MFSRGRGPVLPRPLVLREGHLETGGLTRRHGNTSAVLQYYVVSLKLDIEVTGTAGQLALNEVSRCSTRGGSQVLLSHDVNIKTNLNLSLI